MLLVICDACARTHIDSGTYSGVSISNRLRVVFMTNIKRPDMLKWDECLKHCERYDKNDN